MELRKTDKELQTSYYCAIIYKNTIIHHRGTTIHLFAQEGINE